jgi:NAD+ synthase
VDTVTGPLRLHAAAEVERIITVIRQIVFLKLRRNGAVIGVSGGVDSSVVACLCARALGKDRVVVLFTPERTPSLLNLSESFNVVACGNGNRPVTNRL